MEVSGGVATLGERYSLSCCVSTSGAEMLQPTITYQWLHNGVVLNETLSTLCFPCLNTSDAGQYSCEITLSSALLEQPITAASNTHTLTLESGKENYDHACTI